LQDATVYRPFANALDGVFCRGSINAGWFCGRPAAQADYLRALASTLKREGHAWISPWNGRPSDATERDMDAAVLQLIYTFRALGFRVIKANLVQRRRYGIWSQVAPHLIYTKNLSYTPWPW
jgi:hypothetical protein